MASMPKFSYERLRNEAEFGKEAEERAFRKSRNGSRFRKFNFRKRPSFRIQLLRTFWRKRPKLFSRVKVSCSKILERLKDGKVHMNDLFSGNYLFMQANRALKCRNRSFTGQGLHGLPSSSRYSLGKIA
ncbi:hypothetical protein Patl1_18185 [Pistacia atlantica]|uniref:Uncharacterized protein n=1 Tax=Pistacia atlantica TaxID=434234 RepID=A0ACC1C1T5_9ROSI|nr:hypothetical protein Patl1_18185 [Pistacia atlantica]